MATVPDGLGSLVWRGVAIGALPGRLVENHAAGDTKHCCQMVAPQSRHGWQWG